MVNSLSDIEKTSQILGKENIDCLINLFKEMSGQPPRVDKKRYRANNPNQIETLNYLEKSPYLIKTEIDKTKQFYSLRSYALPLIKRSKAQKILKLMCEIYKKFSVIYKDRLDEAVTKEELLELLEMIDAPSEDILEALSYFIEGHGVLTSWGNGFPYEKASFINLSEDVILRDDFLEVLTDYYRWNFIDKQESFVNTDSQNEIILPDIKVKDKKVGRPSIKNEITKAYKSLKKENKIDYSKTLKSHTELIQKTVELLFPNNTGGMEYETIRKVIGTMFKEEKENL